MKKFKMAIALTLVLLMSVSLLTACGTQTATSSSPSAAATSAAPSAAASAAATSAAPASSASAAASDSKSEVYTMANRIPWAGLIAPTVTSRASIDKAIKASNKKDKVVVGYATWTKGTPFFAALSDTIKAECTKYGWEMKEVVSDADINKQVANIESLVTSKVDVIIDCDFSVEAETPAVKAAVAAGIPVIVLGLPFPDSMPVVTTCATNYYEQGFMVGKLAADQFKGKEAKVATSPGMIGHTIAESKLNGFIGGFVYERAIQNGKPFATREAAMLYGYNLEQQIVKSAKFTDKDYNWSVVTNIDGAWSQDGGMKATEQIYTAHPEINLMFLDNDQETFGAIKALEQAGAKVGKDVLLVCVGDGTKEAMQDIKDGKILGLTLASPYTWAAACTQLAYKIFHDGFDATNLPGCSYLDNVLVTKDNVDKYMTGTTEYVTLPNQVFTPLAK